MTLYDTVLDGFLEKELLPFKSPCGYGKGTTAHVHKSGHRRNWGSEILHVRGKTPNSNGEVTGVRGTFAQGDKLYLWGWGEGSAVKVTAVSEDLAGSPAPPWLYTSE